MVKICQYLAGHHWLAIFGWPYLAGHICLKVKLVHNWPAILLQPKCVTNFKSVPLKSLGSLLSMMIKNWPPYDEQFKIQVGDRCLSYFGWPYLADSKTCPSLAGHFVATEVCNKFQIWPTQIFGLSAIYDD